MKLKKGGKGGNKKAWSLFAEYFDRRMGDYCFAQERILHVLVIFWAEDWSISRLNRGSISGVWNISSICYLCLLAFGCIILSLPWQQYSVTIGGNHVLLNIFSVGHLPDVLDTHFPIGVFAHAFHMVPGISRSLGFQKVTPPTPISKCSSHRMLILESNQPTNQPTNAPLTVA